MRCNLLILFSVVVSGWCFGQRTERVLDHWKFTREDNSSQYTVSFDDSKWEDVEVPHDWAIAGPFDNNVDRQNVAIEQNGEKKATVHTGRTGSLPWVGTGWYRTHVKAGSKAKRVILNFDGAMSEPQVFVNGKKAGEWKYGYSAFNIDITPYIITGADNVIAVRLENRPESSRWYPGAGLFRPVTLIETGDVALEQWGTECITKRIEQGKAYLSVSASVVGGEGKTLTAQIELTHKKGKGKAIRTTAEVRNGKVMAELTVDDARLWSPEHPELYGLSISITEKTDEKAPILDSQHKNIGIRTVEVDKERGFRLNGVERKIKGVCLHHDLGMFGTAVNRGALERQIALLKEMGCDAIRTAHNMPSQMQMDVCDSLGMMVMAESFDMWIYPKCRNGYCLYYKDWWQKDLTNLVLANRLHPSIVMWSIGNEIPEQGGKDGTKMLGEMQDLMHSLDSSRLCTTGMDRVDNAIWSGFAAAIDIPGLNYRTQKYQTAYEQLPQGFILGSETASTVSSRGVYKFPVTRVDGKAYSDGQCSSYDMEACRWSNLPEDDWVLQDDRPWVIGEFVWTGFDYLGEPTPYDGNNMSRSSYFGIIDLAGIPKDRYYLYRSHWNKEEHTIHLLPHWTWPGREGEVTPVYCYTDYPEAELFVNGVSQGRISKKTGLTGSEGTAIDRYRLRWNDVRYQPGEVKVVVYDKDGNKAGEKSIKTAGAPHHLRFDERKFSNLTFVTVSIVDKDGNLCPDADNRITVEVSKGKFRGICNGDATSSEVFVRPTMKAFHGQLVFCVEGKKVKYRVVF